MVIMVSTPLHPSARQSRALQAMHTLLLSAIITGC
jgi:hypothetical protein